MTKYATLGGGSPATFSPYRASFDNFSVVGLSLMVDS